MNVNEYLNQLPPRRDSKLAPYKEELRVLYRRKASAAAIRTYLFDSHGLIVSRQAIWEFCARHFSKETAPANGDQQHSVLQLEPPAVVMSSQHHGTAPSGRAIGDETWFTRTAKGSGSFPRVLQEQTPAQGPAESPSYESEGSFPNDASETPAFQPTPHGHVPNIDQSQPRARNASKLMAFWSAPAMPRRSETESQELDERSEALKAADRQQRREQPR
jgi:hypothetical protein